MRIVAISVLKFLDLSAWENIEIYCENCKTNVPHKPIEQIGKGKTMEIEDVEDAYLVSCIKCGNNIIARYEPPTSTK